MVGALSTIPSYLTGTTCCYCFIRFCWTAVIMLLPHDGCPMRPSIGLNLSNKKNAHVLSSARRSSPPLVAGWRW